MTFWLSFQRWWPTVVPTQAHMPISWIAHGLVTVLIMLPFIAAGHPWTGFWAGVTAYALREADDALTTGPSIDNLGDFIGPVIFGLVLIWIVL